MCTNAYRCFRTFWQTSSQRQLSRISRLDYGLFCVESLVVFTFIKAKPSGPIIYSFRYQDRYLFQSAFRIIPEQCDPKPPLTLGWCEAPGPILAVNFPVLVFPECPPLYSCGKLLQPFLPSGVIHTVSQLNSYLNVTFSRQISGAH